MPVETDPIRFEVGKVSVRVKSSICDRLQLFNDTYRYYSIWWALQRAETCPGYRNVNTVHMISLQRSFDIEGFILVWCLTVEMPRAGRKCSPTGRLFHLQELYGREGGFQCNIYSDLFLSLARGPWEKTGEDKQWTIGFRGWAMVPAQHVPLRDVDYRGLWGAGRGGGGGSQ